MRRLFRTAAVALGLLVAAPVTSAFAITIEAVVNGVAITSYDISQRVALQQISGQSPSAATAEQELIDELIQISEAVRLGLRITNAQIDAAYAQIAAQVGLPVSQFNQALLQAGVAPDTLRRRLQAQIAWQNLLQARIGQGNAVRQEDVTAALLAAGRQNATVREYRLQQVIFVLPQGASSGLVGQRRNEAEAFRQRFGGCDNTLAQAAALREVVVVDIGRDVSRLTSAQAADVEETNAGRMTRPQQTSRGIEVIAVCSITEVAANENARMEIQNELLIERADTVGQEYLAELRARAVIQRF
ncbi:MAG: hypothetical protein AB7O56_06560 [Bauldia sp.]